MRRPGGAGGSPAVRTARRIGLRLLLAIPIVLGIVTITFFLTRALGDPVASIAGPLATRSDVAHLRQVLGLDQSLPRQYVDYVGGLLHGDLGTSLKTNRPVATEIGGTFGGTLELVVLGMLGASIWGVTIGALAAYRRRAGKAFQLLAVLGLAIPDFVLGLALALLFAFTLGWLPAPVGQSSFAAAPIEPHTGGVALDSLIDGDWSSLWSSLSYLVLPVVTLALIYGAPIAKLTESSIRQTLDAPFMEYGELTGLSRGRLLRYVLRNALPSVLTIAVTVTGFLIGGVVLVEIVFAWGGLGQWAAASILALDLPAIQAFVLIAGIVTLLIYLFLDIAYGLIDPRVRRS